MVSKTDLRIRPIYHRNNAAASALGRMVELAGEKHRIPVINKIRRLMGSNLKIKIRGRFPLVKVQEAVDIYPDDMSAGKVILLSG